MVEDDEKTSIYLLDSDFKETSNLETESLPRSFKNFLGYSITGDEYTIFFSNNGKSKFGILKVNFKTKSVINKQMSFKLSKEKYVQSISFKGKFYLLSVSSKPSQLHFYTFTNDVSPSGKNSIDFSFVDKRGKDGYAATAKKLMTGKEFGKPLKNTIVKIDNATPNSIEVASNKNKLYILKDKFLFTFDHEKEKTKIVTVDPNDFSAENSSIEKPFINGEYLKHNSYVHDGKLFQLKCSYGHMKLTIKDLLSKKTIKEIVLSKSDSITFKNSAVLQERVGGIYAGKREFEKTSKFLRKISQGDLSIIAYKVNDKYELTIGSKKVVKSGGAPVMMPGLGAAPIAIGTASFPFNPTMLAYSSYASSKSVRIECLFDSDFNHIDGEIADNVFDDIKSFEDTFDKKNY